MSQEERSFRDMAGIIAACAVVGVAIIVLTLTYGRHIFAANSGASATSAVATEEYGERLMTQTPELIGPDVADAHMRYAGSRMACGSCHLQAGNEAGELSLFGAAKKYPNFSNRTAANRTLEDRIDECMTRSMNGKPLPHNGPELIAMAAWIRDLAARDAATGTSERETKEPEKFKAPNRAASIVAGKTVFDRRCAICHGSDGLGMFASTNPIHGYAFPPLWGPDSFNDGAGMHRMLTAAPYIKARMPLGKPDLTNDEAYDVAAYMNAQPRPQMANLAADFPDKRTKLIDAPYPPYIDPFPIEQHRLGPFGPIETYYKKLKAEEKK